jgi:hypothetical protein
MNSGEIERIDNTRQAAQLERIAASGLLAQGSVNTIELTAIREGMGDKWPKRREQVWAHAEKVLETSVGDAGFFMRLNEASFLISMPDLGGPAAQSKCARILRDLLNFFLGASAHTDILVRNVTFLDGEHIRTTPVNFRPDSLTPEPAAIASPAPLPFLPRRVARASVWSCAGPLLVSFDVEHMYRVREFALAARRIKTNVVDGLSKRAVTPERLQQLETAALAAIDLESLTFALQLLTDPAFKQQGVLVPIAIQTLSTSRARNSVLDLIDEHAQDASRRLVIEIINLTDGTPNGRVREVVHYLRHKVRGVFGRLSMSVQAYKSLKGASLLGTVMDTSSNGDFHTALASSILAYGEVARSLAPALLAGPLPNEDFIDICAVAGVTHVSLQAAHAPLAIHNEPRAAAQTLSAAAPHRVIYVSRSKLGDGANIGEALDLITRQSAQRNGQNYVTGLLAYYNGWFLQVLEGERRAVSEAMRRIMADPRHEDIQLMETCSIKERDFPRWSMSALMLPPEHQLLLNALDPDMRHDPSKLTPDAAMRLMRAIATLKDEELDKVA